MKSAMKNLFYKYQHFLMPIYVLRGSLYFGYRHLRYSGLMGFRSENQSVGQLIASYHTIEKGLTMPDFRPGFGQGAIMGLIAKCNKFIDTYNSDNIHLLHSVQVIMEYRRIHDDLNYRLSEELYARISSLQKRFGSGLLCSSQNSTSVEKYFSMSESPFPDFVTSRGSIRNFDEKVVPEEIIFKAVEFAKSAPSACNRQSIRVHCIQDKVVIHDILALQGGSRGFSHKVRSLLVITTDIGAYFGPNELTTGWVDGGMFAMNLCLSLHYLKIGSCPLNCSFSVEKQRSIRRLLPIPKHESLVVMLAIGFPPAEFKYPASKRYEAHDILVFH